MAVRKNGNTYRCRSLKVLVKAITKTDPECDEKRYKGNHAKGKATCSNSYFPQSHDECMDGEYLTSCASVS